MDIQKKNIMKRNNALDKELNEHSVLIFLKFGRSPFNSERKLDAIFELENIIAEVVEKTGVGQFDGNEFCEDTVTFFIYGPDADKIVEELYPIIVCISYMSGSYIIKRYGDLGDREEQIFLK